MGSDQGMLANTSDTEASSFIYQFYGVVSSKIYDKRDDFDFDIVNFLVSDGEVPRTTSYISQLIRFARVPSQLIDFNARNKSNSHTSTIRVSVS